MIVHPNHRQSKSQLRNLSNTFRSMHEVIVNSEIEQDYRIQSVLNETAASVEANIALFTVSFLHLHYKVIGNCEEELPSTDCRSSVGRQATDRPPTDDQQVTDRLPTVSQNRHFTVSELTRHRKQ